MGPSFPLRIAYAALISAVVCVAYWSALEGGFIWDDEILLTQSDAVKDPSLSAIWFSSKVTDYWPVSNSTLWLEWRLWGMNPLGYHVSNLVLHIGASLLVWAVLRQLSIPGAFLAALLFAVHPVNVEAVAWIAQRKTLLASCFFLLAILSYLTFEDSRRWGWYGLSLAAFTLGMLSKGSIATLPLVLLLVTWWRRGRIAMADLARVAPFVLVAVPLVMVNIWFQTHGSGAVIRDAGFTERLLSAGAAVWFYLGKAVLPMNLLFVYPMWTINATDFRWWLPLLAAVTVTVALWHWRATRIGRGLLFAWLFYGLALAPVLGFTDVCFFMYSLVADHYQYIALIAVVSVVGAAWSAWRAKAPVSALAAASFVIVACIFLSAKQAALYSDAETIWTHTLARNTNCLLAHNNLGTLYVQQGKLTDALTHFATAATLKPDDFLVQCNLGTALNDFGRAAEALGPLRRAVELNPKYARGHNNLALALRNLGRLAEAEQEHAIAVTIDPEYAIAWFNLGTARIRLGHEAQGLRDIQRARDLAASQDDTTTIQQIDAWLKRYRSGN